MGATAAELPKRSSCLVRIILILTSLTSCIIINFLVSLILRKFGLIEFVPRDK
jgi:hypothetical protein